MEKNNWDLETGILFTVYSYARSIFSRILRYTVSLRSFIRVPCFTVSRRGIFSGERWICGMLLLIFLRQT
jgi:hypothetical protein